MADEKWEKLKKHDKLGYLTIDEIIILLVGFSIFLFFQPYRVAYIIFVILWYWLKIRYYERKIIIKEREVYNVLYDNIEPIPQGLIEKRTEKDREPMKYDLKQLENNRKFLVDKFVVLNLILIVLIELFIKNN